MPVVAPATSRVFYINANGHDPAAILDYAITLADYLRTGESVSTITWTSYEEDGTTTTDPPFTVDTGATSASPQAATVTEGGVTYTKCEVVWLYVTGADIAAKNARAGDTGIITLTFTTNQGRTEERSFKLYVAQQ